jgi:carbon-monoxide dehydrogenase medium subunit
MKPARFSYEAPATLSAALAALASRPGEARIIAGGQSLVPMMNMRLAQPAHLIDINGIEELARVRFESGSLAIGALVRHADLARDPRVCEHCPILAHAADSIGHYAIRQRGTIGGSLAHADPAAQLALIARLLEAEMEIAALNRRRIVAAAEFFRSIFTTALEPDELLVCVRLPALAAGEGWGFRLLARRAGDFAIASVAITLTLRLDRAVERLRLAIGGIGPVPVRIDDANLREAGDPLDADWGARIAAGVSIGEGEDFPIEYRRELVAALAQDALADALERAR